MTASAWRSGLVRVLDHFDMRVTARKQYDLAKYWLDVPGLFRDRASRRRGAPDGLPLPPPELIHLVVGRYAVDNFFDEGAALASVIKDVLTRQSINPADLQSLLDFGCGCGRVTRHWATLGARVYGCDYNARLVEWCRRSLPFAQFEKNGLAPPLPYAAETFDFVYAVSVFTHLPESLQRPWIMELRRVLRPEGHVLLTFKGRSRVNIFGPIERDRFEAGKLVEVGSRYGGTNVCDVYHPERFVREVLASGYDVVEFLPGGAEEPRQDIYLLRRGRGIG